MNYNFKPCHIFYFISVLVCIIIVLALFFLNFELEVVSFSWHNIVISLIISLLASLITAWLIDYSKYKALNKLKYNDTVELLRVIREIVLNLVVQLNYIMLEDPPNDSSNNTIKSMIDKYPFLNYRGDCQTFKLALSYMKSLYEEAIRIKSLEGGRLDTNYLGQIIHIIKSYEMLLKNQKKLIKASEVFRKNCDYTLYIDKENNIHFDPIESLNSKMHSFILSINYLFDKDGIFYELSQKEVIIDEGILKAKIKNCKDCKRDCKPHLLLNNKTDF